MRWGPVKRYGQVALFASGVTSIGFPLPQSPCAARWCVGCRMEYP